MDLHTRLERSVRRVCSTEHTRSFPLRRRSRVGDPSLLSRPPAPRGCRLVSYRPKASPVGTADRCRDDSSGRRSWALHNDDTRGARHRPPAVQSVGQRAAAWPANGDVSETAPSLPPSPVTRQRPSVAVSMRITTPPGTRVSTSAVWAVSCRTSIPSRHRRVPEEDSARTWYADAQPGDVPKETARRRAFCTSWV